MFPEVQQLRDIHAAMGNPWWPPAPGWWLLLALLLLLALVIWRFDSVWRLRVPIPMVTLGTWRWDAGGALRRLRRDADSAAVKDTASALSELLRRIAMARHGRAACAGLHGEDWLAWLSAHDPKGFDWRASGQVLLNAPYAPPSQIDSERAALKRLIDAATDWVVAGHPKPERTRRRRPDQRERTT
jgi:hypothetical protein